MPEITLNLKKDFPYTDIQKLWITQLKSYPNRQMKNELGQGTPEEYHACCLGEGILCIARVEGTELPFKKLLSNDFFTIVSDKPTDDEESIDTSFPSHSQADKLGLFTNNGKIMDKYKLPDNHWASVFASLSEANDEGITWTDIAELMEEYPEVVFSGI